MILARLLKGAKGSERPGHEYVSRTPDGKGGWNYVYPRDVPGHVPPKGERIVKLHHVEDTRTYEEQGDRWVPIPGSGNGRPCDRCGRMHEVHAHVHLDVKDGEDWAEAAAARLRSQGHKVSLKFASGHGPPPEEAKRQIDMFKARRPFWRPAARPFWAVA